jgi:hypothetical protein
MNEPQKKVLELIEQAINIIQYTDEDFKTFRIYDNLLHVKKIIETE